MRESRIITPNETWDDWPDCEPLEAGSAEEHDMLSEWDRSELVDKIQQLDTELHQAEVLIEEYKKRDPMKECKHKEFNYNSRMAWCHKCRRWWDVKIIIHDFIASGKDDKQIKRNKGKRR